MTSQVYQLPKRGDNGGGTFSSPRQDVQATSKRRHRITRKLLHIAQLPLEAWWLIWTYPDEYYEGREKDLISTICYVTLKVIWVLVSILWVWLWICPFFGF